MIHPLDSSDFERFEVTGSLTEPEWFTVPNSPKAVQGGDGARRPKDANKQQTKRNK